MSGNCVVVLDTKWTPWINKHLMRCPCGARFWHRADRSRIACPDCGRRENLHVLRRKPERWHDRPEEA